MQFDGRHLVVCLAIAATSFIAGVIYGWIVKDEEDAYND